MTGYELGQLIKQAAPIRQGLTGSWDSMKFNYLFPQALADKKLAGQVPGYLPSAAETAAEAAKKVTSLHSRSLGGFSQALPHLSENTPQKLYELAAKNRAIYAAQRAPVLREAGAFGLNKSRGILQALKQFGSKLLPKAL